MLLTVIVLSSLASCATLPQKNITAAAGSTAAPALDSANIAPEKPDTYSLGPDDIVRVTVEQHPEWSGEFPIRPDGNIFVPGIGDFRMQGLTRQTAAIALASHLEEYINNPRVAVEIVRYASQVIYVLGEVERPGRYSTEGKSVSLRIVRTRLRKGIPGTNVHPLHGHRNGQNRHGRIPRSGFHHGKIHANLL
jgi:polysaccharide export outer membrane protein